MKIDVENEKGLTLIEVLAVIVIGSILIVLIMNVLISAQKQYKNQFASAENLYDVSYAAKVITKEIRKANPSEIENIGSNDNHIKLSPDIEFKHNIEDKTIERKDGTVLVKGIEEFYIKRIGNKLPIEIAGASGKKIDTEIILRGGG